MSTGESQTQIENDAESKTGSLALNASPIDSVPPNSFYNNSILFP